ncbi:MAG: helix-turn-helix domain-containing protein [Spirochaetaceae bacterium]|jgi:DNA-binding LacI/PurR family transcriptional regulator/AraC-like DNA-binding protein|nr:helix-turn-helix domain-containing protein [Spirochaetaceae bacterium]
MACVKKKIGLALASIHIGTAQNVWPCFVKTALLEHTSLFIFPGGRLNARQDSENLRNPVYSLMNAENLDGLISWSSTIRYTESQEEFERFHAQFDPLPYVTLAYKIPGHPCVEFDAYNGMKALVEHCIQAHGARNIAFLRGPDFHASARDRFQGYQDALQKAGLPLPPQSPLVTDPFNWSSGDAAAAQLVKDRSLVPGRDFDTLIGSSDLMALGAVKYLAKAGYHAPQDYRAGGFNNSIESMLPESPLSTVQIPFDRLCGESFKILLQLLKVKKKPISDVRLPSKLVLRESCGCDYRVYGGNRGMATPGSPEMEEAGRTLGLFRDVLTRMTVEYLNLDGAAAAEFVVPLSDALFYRQEAQFFQRFEKALFPFFQSQGDIEGLLRFLAGVSSSALLPTELLVRLEPALYQTVFHVRERLATRKQYEKEQGNAAVHSLKCALLGARDRRSLIRSLARHLPKIGITTVAIVFFEDEKLSRLVGAFSPQGIHSQGELPFPAKLLVPPVLEAQYAEGIFMVQPLFIENQSLGYVVHTVPRYDGLLFEELRSAVSYALKGIFLLEEAVRSQRLAEQAEEAKTELLRTLENELYNPLAGMMEQVEELEKKAPADHCLAEPISRLKSLIQSREAEAGSLIDLALSRIEPPVLRKTLFCLEELLPGIGVFPVLLGDPERLSQVFSLIRQVYREGVSAALRPSGCVLTFRGAENASFPEGNPVRRRGLLLAEQILRAHGGQWCREDGRCLITLPWISLTGAAAAVKAINRQDHVLALSDTAFLPEDFFDLPLVRDIPKARALPGRTAFILWNAAAATKEECLSVLSLRRIGEFQRTPFLCYGKGPCSPGVCGAFTGGRETSVAEAIEKVLKTPSQGLVLTVGFRENREYPRWDAAEALQGEIIRIDSMGAFNDTVAELIPSLIILDTVSAEAADTVRLHPLTTTVPLVMLGQRLDSEGELAAVSGYSRVIVCHRSVASSQEFSLRLRALLGGDEILPPHTGALVKKALLYFDRHVAAPIYRWKLAEAVHVSEDYLSRIFHRELGLSLWDYLSRYRVFRAAELLRKTNDPVQEIAFRTGFQDQAYFCRVFKKIAGCSPGQLRKRPE